MTIAVELTQDQLTADIIAKLDSGAAPPWRDRAAIGLGLSLSGSTKKVYGGITPFLLWEAALQGGYTRNIWFTENAAIRRRGEVREGASSVVVRGHRVFNIDDIEGLVAPSAGFPAADVARRRVLRLVRFVQATLAQGAKATYKAHNDTITLPPAANFKNPDDYCVSALTALMHWTGGPRRLRRPAAGMPSAHPKFPVEALTAELGTAMLCAWIGIHGTAQDQEEMQHLWAGKVKLYPKMMAEAAGMAQDAFQYVKDLAPSDLLTDKKPQKRRGKATALGEVLEIPFDEVGKGDWEEEQLVLTLPEAPGNALRQFFTDFSGNSGRRKPAPYAFITGGSGSGRNQVVAALGELLLTGGTDLDGSLLQSENDDGALLDSIGNVWETDHFHVVPCALPSPGSVAPDRALATACLGAFHVQQGLSPVMWAARFEHVLERSGDYEEFAGAFQAFAGRRWRGGANRNPNENFEQMIEALGGDADDMSDEDTRRVHHYRKTRATATWAALTEEVEDSVYRIAKAAADRDNTELPDNPPPRVLFVVDMAPAFNVTDKDDKKWLRRVLKEVRERAAELAEGGESRLWFLFCASETMHDVAELADWSDQDKKIVKTHIALERHPVTGAFKQRLLAKIPDQCAPLYRMYADNKSMLQGMAKLEGWPAPVRGDRSDIIDSFPFLPCVLPVAQAVLDTMVGGDVEDAAIPLEDLVEKAIDEHYYGPLDRFIALDVLFEPLSEKLEAELEQEGGARVRTAPSAAGARPAAAAVIIMPTAAAAAKPKPRMGMAAQMFPAELVLRTLRLANRVREFPCTAENLLRLMFVRVEEDYEEMVEEVKETLVDMKERGFVKSSDDENWTFVKMR